VTASCATGSFAISGGCNFTNGNGQVDLPVGVVNGSSGTAATGWLCTNTANNPDNTTAYALCCVAPESRHFGIFTTAEDPVTDVGSDQTIQGTIAFMQRVGITPGSLDEMPYWSVIVQSNGVDYELSHVFGIEYGVRPESTTIAGKTLQAGDRVTIAGKAQRIRKDFSLLSKIGSIELK